LLGHALECLALGLQRGVVTLTPAQRRERDAAVATVRRMIEDMEKKNIMEARGLNRDLFRQLVGDTCHARHAFVLS
jgi:hypothetical protein